MPFIRVIAQFLVGAHLLPFLEEVWVVYITPKKKQRSAQEVPVKNDIWTFGSVYIYHYTLSPIIMVQWKKAIFER